jgi:membrane associated rhomboid family serine protease
MIPYKDDNPQFLTPVVTLGLIAANVAVWLLVQGAGSQPALARSVCELGLIPGEVLHRVPAGQVVNYGEELSCVLGTTASWFTPLTSMFMHGGWAHLLGNMWFLWVFGNNVEDAMGHSRFLWFYLLCGLLAAGAQMLVEPTSVLPMVGASGAISGVMGAYILLYPTVRVHMFTLIVFYPFRFTVPAVFMIGYWFLLQVLGIFLADVEAGGVAFWAHVGGFVSGMLLIGLFRDPELVARHRRLAAWS